MRQAFEDFIKHSPFEMDTQRFPDKDKYAWPGCYKDHTVGMMWETWEKAWSSAIECALEIVRNTSAAGGTVNLREAIIRAIKERHHE